MEFKNHDILIVGGGGAGLRAAIAIGEENPNLSVGVISKVYPMRSHTVSAEGGAAAVIKPNDSLDDHIYDTISGAAWLADQDAVEAFVNEAPAEMIQLEHWGCPWSREPDGSVAVRPFGGMKIERTWFAADKTGFHMLHTLFQTALKYDNLTRYDEWFATKLLVHDGRCQGVAALELRTGQIRAIAGKSTILCTGGAGRIFPFTTNAAIKTGDGMALAYRAGVALKDMEFVQYHPTGLPGTGILITEAARGEGGILRNREDLDNVGSGKDGFMAAVAPTVKDLAPRDMVSRAMYNEISAGRGMEGTRDTGSDYLVLDLVHLGEKVINEKLPDISHFARKYLAVEPITEPIPVQPTAHYAMGGVPTDVDGRVQLNAKLQPVNGLYAAGEVACASVHGANRLGTNSLVDIVVFGRRAGKSMTQYLQDSEFGRISGEPDGFVLGEIDRLKNGSGKEKVAELRRAMQKTMMAGVGVYRTKQTITESRDTVMELRRRYQEVAISDQSNFFNTELVEALELGFLLDVAWMIAESALNRTESRGAHSREDFKERDDKNWLKHSFITLAADEKVEFDYKPVVITKFQPKPRVY